MPVQTIFRTVEFKIYPNKSQIATLTRWLGKCCWLYNLMLEHRIKAWKRRKQSVSFSDQCVLLTSLRERIESLSIVPVHFARDSLRRLDRAFQAFFRRCKSGEKPGFPRYKPYRRYDSMEVIDSTCKSYLRDNRIRIPKLGLIRCRGINQDTSGKQKLMRVIRRASGWYCQILFERSATPLSPPESVVGIDVGLESFATLSTGEQIPNPRFYRRSQRKLRSLSQRVSRKANGSKNRRKAVARLRRHHERVAAQRKNFAHQESRKIVNRFKLIGFENLNINGLARTRLAKSIHDAAWGMFLWQISYKVENTGSRTIANDPRGTSQTCPVCRRVRKKELSERVHDCPCGLRCHRDFASAWEIEVRTAVASRRGVTPVESGALAGEFDPAKLPSVKQEV